MIEIQKSELIIDETVLAYATDEKIKKLRDTAKAISQRIKQGGGDNE